MKKLNKKLQILGIIVVTSLVIFFLVRSDKSQSKTTSVPSPSPTAYVEPKFNNQTYKNKKYNFQFEYSGSVKESGNQLIITLNNYNRDGSVSHTSHFGYTIYDANVSDKDDLYKWWKTNFKTDIEGKKVPDDYLVDPSYSNLKHCNETATNIQNAPVLEVTLVGPAYHTSTYIYFNFGKPFVLNFDSYSTGACGNDPILPSLKRLN